MNTSDMRSAIPYVIIGMLAVLLFQQTCRKPEQKPTADTTRYYQQQPIVITVPQTQPYLVTIPSQQQLPQTIDTAAVIRKFFSTVEYRDTIRSDTADIYLKETVEKNLISSRQVGFKLNIPLQTIINKPVTLKNRYYIGLKTYGPPFTIFPEASITTKNRMEYSAGYNLFDKRVSFGAKFQIK